MAEDKIPLDPPPVYEEQQNKKNEDNSAQQQNIYFLPEIPVDGTKLQLFQDDMKHPLITIPQPTITVGATTIPGPIGRRRSAARSVLLVIMSLMTVAIVAYMAMHAHRHYMNYCRHRKANNMINDDMALMAAAMNKAADQQQQAIKDDDPVLASSSVIFVVVDDKNGKTSADPEKLNKNLPGFIMSLLGSLAPDQGDLPGRPDDQAITPAPNLSNDGSTPQQSDPTVLIMRPSIMMNSLDKMLPMMMKMHEHMMNSMLNGGIFGPMPPMGAGSDDHHNGPMPPDMADLMMPPPQHHQQMVMRMMMAPAAGGPPAPHHMLGEDGHD